MLLFVNLENVVHITVVKCYLKLLCFFIKLLSLCYWPREIQHVLFMQVLRDNKQYAACQLYHINFYNTWSNLAVNAKMIPVTHRTLILCRKPRF